ncbi:MAG: rod shape-determining protein MreD [Pyrinomonadaceae bacterium]|nr:rod shape-determining protein MreD [Pyrinomonadaceae bacterium]
MKLKIAFLIALVVILQASLRRVWPPLVYIDLPLIAVVYFALQRDTLQAIVIGTIAGLATDALSGGILGAGGFSKTVVAYLIATLTTRVVLDNTLIRIPVLAGAVGLDSFIYVLLHRLLNQPSMKPFAEVTSFRLIATTVVGTMFFYALDALFSDRARQRRAFAFRRRSARRFSRRR